MTTTITGATGIDNIQAATGAVLQVVSTTKSDTQTISGTTFVDVMSATITPTSTSSKIMVTVTMAINCNERYSAAKLYRDSTQIGLGDTDGNRARVFLSAQNNQNALNDHFVMHSSSSSYLDSPSTTSAVVYKIQAGNTYNSSSVVTYINSPVDGGNDFYIHRGISTITLQEIAG